jgi:nucleoside permease NupC
LKFEFNLLTWDSITISSYFYLKYIVGKLFWPVAWLMGVPSEECDLVAGLVALKTIVNEFAAYSKLSEYIAAGMISVSAHKFVYSLLLYDHFVNIMINRNEQRQ